MLAALPQPKAILFDWDGTLNDSMRRIHDVLRECMQIMGRPEPTVQQAIDTTIYGQHAGLKVFDFDAMQNEQFLTLFNERFFVFTPEHAVQMDGAERLMTVLPSHMRLGIVTNGRRDLIEAQIAHHGWQDRFDVVVCAGEAIRNKPYPDPALLALEKLGIAPGPDVWFVGDTRGDIECARAAGLTGILLADTSPADCDPHHHVIHLDYISQHFEDTQ